jgi:DNA-binding PadR family transcriptional regulator
VKSVEKWMKCWMRLFTRRRRTVLVMFLEHPAAALSGADVVRLTGLGSGLVYSTLYGLEARQLLESWWAAEDPPRRRLYKLTALGERTAREQL